MPFKDAYRYQEAVRALSALDEGRIALETAQTAFEDAARSDDAERIAEAILAGLDDLLSDLEVQTEPMRDRIDAFDEYDPSDWDAA